MSDARLLTVAGEASSDAHAAGLLTALRRAGWRGECDAVGGPALAAAGARLIADHRDLAVVGVSEALERLPRILRLLERLKREIRRHPPDLFLPVDTPEFNLRLLPVAASRRVPVVYFVAPQLWAWRPGRIRALRGAVRELLVLFPFEEPWFRERGVPATYVGHPLVDRARALREESAVGGATGAATSTSAVGAEEGDTVLLLPGSRASEVRHHLPALAGAVRLLRASRPRLRWRLRRAPGLDASRYQPWAEQAGIELTDAPVLELAAQARLTLAASGTASLEAALAGSPLVVVYRVSPASWWIARRLVRVPHVAMANLALGRAVVPELLQSDCTAERIAEEAAGLLDEPARAARMRAELAELDARFGPSGALTRAAARVLAHLDRRGR